MERWDALAQPVDRSSIEFFRILFGAVMFWEVARYLSYGWVSTYNEQTHHLHYPLLDWVRPLPPDQLQFFFLAMGVLATMIMIGMLTRLASIAFFFGFVYWFGLEATDYLNHLYLVGLLSFLLMVLPLGRSLSIDAWVFPHKARSATPGWTLELLRWQVGLVYFFGGLAKIGDDWLQAQPLRMWLEDYCEREWPGELVAEPISAWIMSYSGLLIDLFAFPLLMWKKTRIPMMGCLVLFHLFNAWLFQIGIFPWLMIGALLLYLEPDWASRLLNRIRSRFGRTPRLLHSQTPEPLRFRGGAAWFFGLWLALQTVVPLRHFFYPGSPHWTEEGHWFAWHMKLRSKSSTTDFYIEDLDTGEEWRVDLTDYFDARQTRKLSGHPELIRQTAHILAENAAEDGHTNVAVTVEAWVSLNGRVEQQLIDPTVDLSREPFRWGPSPWIIPRDRSVELDPPSIREDPCP